MYVGNFLEDAMVYITFNTFDSNDPSASVTITDLAQGDVEIWKNGVVQTTPGSGVTLTLNIGTGNGTHLIAVDTSDTTDSWFVINADYQVRITGTTIDGATVNAWVGSFSIENRFKEVNVTAMAAGVIANATFAADVGSTAHGDNIIALAVRKILEELNLDHLLKVDTTVAADGDLEDYVVAGTVLAHVMAAGADATAFKASTDSLEAIKVHADSIKTETALIVEDTSELQGDDIPGTLSTNDTSVDTQLADIKAETVLIVEDTNAIQGKLPTNKFMGSSDGADDDGTLNDIVADTGELQVDDYPTSIAAIKTVVDDLDTLTKAAGDGDLAAILVDTGTTIPATITTAQNDLDIITGGSGVLIDTDAVSADALNADAITEIWAKAMSDLDTGAPSATASVLTAINVLYEAFRNKTETTATLITIMKDDGTTDLMKSTISDAGGTTTKEEFVSG